MVFMKENNKPCKSRDSKINGKQLSGQFQIFDTKRRRVALAAAVSGHKQRATNKSAQRNFEGDLHSGQEKLLIGLQQLA